MPGRITILEGDMQGELRKIVAAGVQVHSVVTDPPYHLKFMGKAWDGGDIAFQPATWRLCYDLLPPGGHLLCFGGTRTFHRLVCAVEDAGFTIRDTVAWITGSGFPKSHNLDGDWNGWGTALKPAMELICVARKPLVGTVAANVLAHGTGALNIDACRVAGTKPVVLPIESDKRNNPILHTKSASGNGEMTNVGRWPANVVTDGSDEVVKGFPESGPSSSGGVAGWQDLYVGGKYKPIERTGYDEPAGSAARFFYSAKADSDDRLGSKHPTVKPVDLMRWLVRLVTPPGGTVLDCFAGSGTTGMACMAEGFDAILVEREAAYVADIKARIAHVRGEDMPLFTGLMQE